MSEIASRNDLKAALDWQLRQLTVRFAVMMTVFCVLAAVMIEAML